jgi:hypothetical protein
MKNILLISSDAGQVILFFSVIILIFIAMFIKDEIEQYDNRIKRKNDQIKFKKEQDKERELLTIQLNEVKKDYIGKEFIFSKRFVLDMILTDFVHIQQQQKISLFDEAIFHNYLSLNNYEKNLKDFHYKLKCIDLKLIEYISFGGLNCNTIIKFGIDESVVIEFKLLHIIHADNNLFNTEEYIKISNKYGEDNIIRSLGGHFLINSTKEEVEIAIGKPDKIIKKIKSDCYETYNYHFKKLNVSNVNEYSIKNSDKIENNKYGVKLFFKNNKLDYIEEY